MKRLLALLLLWASCAQAKTVILYSHADIEQARLWHRIAGVFDPDVVVDFLIPPGLPWRQIMQAQILEADVVIVLWSTSAAKSTELAHEWRLAMGAGKKVVPVLLDPRLQLPSPLSEAQGFTMGRPR